MRVDADVVDIVRLRLLGIRVGQIDPTYTVVGQSCKGQARGYGFFCTRAHGHEGPCIAHGVHGFVHLIFSRDDWTICE
jgi:hypothetical protein